jgi:GntR family transcriptional regulator
MTSNRFRLSTRPLYLQLRDALVERIARGDWKPGAAIPNEGDLARECTVSTGTMRKALDVMEAERLLTRTQGRGTFVNDQGSGELAIRFSNIRNSDGARIAGHTPAVKVSEGKATDLEAERLQLDPQDAVYRLRRVRYREDRPYMVDETSMPAAMFPGLTDGRKISPRITVLSQQYGILLGKSSERVSMGQATPAMAEMLGLRTGAPLLVLDRVVTSLDGRPVEWRVGHCHFVDECYMVELK